MEIKAVVGVEAAIATQLRNKLSKIYLVRPNKNTIFEYTKAIRVWLQIKDLI